MKKIRFWIFIITILNYLDLAFYNFMAPWLGALFFPKHETVLQLVFMYSITLSYVLLKPFGIILFSSMAKRHGSIRILAITACGIAASTMLFAIVPTYETLGWLAPSFVILARTLRGFFASGEGMIALIVNMHGCDERTSKKHSNMLQTCTMIGVVLGSLIASFCASMQGAWRLILLLIGVITFCAAYSRLKMPEPKSLANIQKNAGLIETFKAVIENRWNILCIVLAQGLSQMTYYVPSVLIYSLVPLMHNHISKEALMHYNTIVLIFDMLAIPVLGKLTRNIKAEYVMLTASGVLALTFIPIIGLLNSSDMLYIMLARLYIILVGVLFLCPLDYWCKSLIAAEHRYEVIGFASIISNGLIGKAVLPMSLLLWREFGSTFVIGLFYTIIAAMSFFAIVLHIFLHRRTVRIESHLHKSL